MIGLCGTCGLHIGGKPLSEPENNGQFAIEKAATSLVESDRHVRADIDFSFPVPLVRQWATDEDKAAQWERMVGAMVINAIVEDSRKLGIVK